MELTRPRAWLGLRAVLLAIVSCVLVLTLAGCVTAEGGPPKQLQRAIEQASSSEMTVRLSLQQLQDGKTLPTTASTTVEQMLTQVQSAQKDAEGVSADTPAQSRARDKVVKTIAATARALLAVQHYLDHRSGEEGFGVVMHRLTANRSDLKSLHSSLGAAR